MTDSPTGALSERDILHNALSALVLNIDAGGATLGAMADARAALASRSTEPGGEALCGRCNGSGEQSYLSGGGPDAHNETGPCSECGGSGASKENAHREVPREPTQSMVAAAENWKAKGWDWPKAMWRAMWDAAPVVDSTPPMSACKKTAPDCPNCFEGKSDLHHVCRLCNGTGTTGDVNDRGETIDVDCGCSASKEAAPEAYARICEAQADRWKDERAIYVAHECAKAIRAHTRGASEPAASDCPAPESKKVYADLCIPGDPYFAANPAALEKK